jgi:hypothetical protein
MEYLRSDSSWDLFYILDLYKNKGSKQKEKEDEAVREFNETLKKFESDYPNIEYTKLEMECVKYLKTGLEEERSEILVNLKELEIKEIKLAEAEAERKNKRQRKELKEKNKKKNKRLSSLKKKEMKERKN